MAKWMKLKAFCRETGIPITLMRNALRGEYRNLIGRKVHPEKEKSDWLIDADKALELFKAREI